MMVSDGVQRQLDGLLLAVAQEECVCARECMVSAGVARWQAISGGLRDYVIAFRV